MACSHCIFIKCAYQCITLSTMTKTIDWIMKQMMLTSLFIFQASKLKFLVQGSNSRMNCIDLGGTSSGTSERNLCALRNSMQWNHETPCISSTSAFICFSFAPQEKKNVCFKSYLSLISVCSVVFNITYWKNFNSSFAMKSFVILQQALPTEL